MAVAVAVAVAVGQHRLPSRSRLPPSPSSRHARCPCRPRTQAGQLPARRRADRSRLLRRAHRSPPPPKSLSLPALPLSLSAFAVPLSVSFPTVPVIVAAPTVAAAKSTAPATSSGIASARRRADIIGLLSRAGFHRRTQPASNRNLRHRTGMSMRVAFRPPARVNSLLEDDPCTARCTRVAGPVDRADAVLIGTGCGLGSLPCDHDGLRPRCR